MNMVRIHALTILLAFVYAPKASTSSTVDGLHTTNAARVSHQEMALLGVVGDHSDHTHLHDEGERCGAITSEEERRMMMEAQEHWEDINSVRSRRLGKKRDLWSATIPVYFHVITGNTGDLSVSDRTSIMNRLNEAFAQTGFKFVYQGSTVTADGVRGAISACTQSNIGKFQKIAHVGSADTLNIYVCDTSRGGKTLSLGFATTPPSVLAGYLPYDGIGVAHPDAFSLADTEESVIHEVGHFLGLLHTFQSADPKDGCDTSVYDRDNHVYRLSGDGVADTPPHFAHTLKSRQCAYSTCCVDENGKSTLNTCPGLPGRDPVKNFMNYIATKCSAKYGEFTPGQISRMIAQYEIFRSPARKLNCGCPKSCTAEVLATTAFVYDDVTYTCKDDILDAINDLGDEWRGCTSTGSIYPACSKCNSMTCASFSPGERRRKNG